MTRRFLALMAAVILTVVLSLTFELYAQRAPFGTWITAWGTSQNGLAMTSITNATVRMVARVTIGLREARQVPLARMTHFEAVGKQERGVRVARQRVRLQSSVVVQRIGECE